MRKSTIIFGVVLCGCISTVFADPGNGTLVVAGEKPYSFARSVLRLPSPTTPPSSSSPTVDALTEASGAEEQESTISKIMDKWVIGSILSAGAWTLVALQLFAAMPDDYPIDK